MDFINWFTEPFQLDLQQRALFGGMLAALISSLVGVWLVLRGMSFFGDAFVHGVVPGIAAAILFDFSPYLGAALAAVVIVAGLELVHRMTTLKEDTAIGLLFVGMMALGVVMISKTDSYVGDLTSILFGDAMGVSREDIRAQLIFAVIVIIMSVLLYRPLMALSFSPAKAQSLGMLPKMTHWLLLVMIAIAVIGSFQAVGTILVFGLLVGPAAAAALMTRTVPRMMLTALIIGVASSYLGLVISYHFGTAASATMAIIPVIFFFMVLIVRETHRRLTHSRTHHRAAQSTHSVLDPDSAESMVETAHTTAADTLSTKSMK